MIDPLPAPWLHEHALLGEADCLHWTERVLGLKRSWTPRNKDAPFFTLGMAAYLDALHAEADLQHRTPYQTPALRDFNNRLITREFAPLLETCRAYLEKWQGLPTVYDATQTALPGFHIHLPHAAFTNGVASIHNDLQFQQVFPSLKPTPSEVLTFTLALSLPAGSGLKVWNSDSVRFQPYALGHIYLHSGLHQHQAVLHPEAGGTPRICLQGHGLVRDNQLILYW
jgi:hypothetical protein